jgi:ATP-dependent helicase/nuclease subunit B
MLRVVTGPFHPFLQASLVSALQQLKSRRPEAPVVIVVPSEHLRRHLKCVLCLDHGCALSAVHIFTFHQLALHLHQEYRQRTSGSSGRRIELVSDLFFEQLLQQLGNRKLPWYMDRAVDDGARYQRCHGGSVYGPPCGGRRISG